MGTSFPEREELDRLMRENAIKAAQLSSAAGVSKGTISKILHQTKYEPSYSTMKSLFGAIDEMTRMSHQSVEDLLKAKQNPKPTTVDEGDRISTVKAKMKGSEFSQLPIVSNGRVLGLVTESSLIQNPEASVAKDALTYDYAMIEPTKSRAQAKELILKVQALLVTGGDGKLKGILTKSDFL